MGPNSPETFTAVVKDFRKSEFITFELSSRERRTIDLRGFRSVAESIPKPGRDWEGWEWIEEFALRGNDAGFRFTELRTFDRA